MTTDLMLPDIYADRLRMMVDAEAAARAQDKHIHIHTQAGNPDVLSAAVRKAARDFKPKVVAPLADRIATWQVVAAESLNDESCRLQPDAKHAAAVVALRRAVALAPQEAPIWGNLSSALLMVQDYAASEAAARQALAINPAMPGIYANLCAIAIATGDFSAAEAAIDQALTLDPTNAGLLWDRALMFLARGDWAAGLEDYDARIAYRGAPTYPKLPAPQWTGGMPTRADWNGKRVFVQLEQGNGDRILFSRYLAMLAEEFPNTAFVIGVDATLASLFWGFTDLVEIIPLDVAPTGIDYAVYCGSLMRWHGTRADNVPPDPGIIRRRVEARRDIGPFNLPRTSDLLALKVGICWTGSATQPHNAERSVPLEMLASLASDPRITLYNLVPGPARSDLAGLGYGRMLCDLGPELIAGGYMATALAMLELDVVVTVCTSVAHLAGALGVPCLLLLCSDPYWIWGRSGDKTPWYPSITIYRQPRAGDWATPISAIRNALISRAGPPVSER